jgi:hypothetical protein
VKIKAIILTLLAVAGIYSASIATKVNAQPLRTYIVEFRCRRAHGRLGHLRTVVVRARRKSIAAGRAHARMSSRCGGRSYRVVLVRRR